MISHARVQVESRSKDGAFDCTDYLRSPDGVLHLDLIPLCPIIAINAGLTHPPQRVRLSRP